MSYPLINSPLLHIQGVHYMGNGRINFLILRKFDMDNYGIADIKFPQNQKKSYQNCFMRWAWKSNKKCLTFVFITQVKLKYGNAFDVALILLI